MTSDDDLILGKAWQDWRGSLTQEDMEGDPRELVYSAFRVAWRESYAASQARVERLEAALEELIRQGQGLTDGAHSYFSIPLPDGKYWAYLQGRVFDTENAIIRARAAIDGAPAESGTAL